MSYTGGYTTEKELLFQFFAVAFLLLFCVTLLYTAYGPAQEFAAKPPETVTIEGHDYFAVRVYGGGFSLTHKGNCKKCNKN